MPLSPVSPSTGSTRERSTAARSKTVGDRFLIGEELGKGAHGMVFKGIDLQNGDFVAVKQVSLEGMNQQDLASIMVEIDLLKNLRHKNIVKYLGSFKTKNHLYIFLEYAENGALAGIIKPSKFGAFPESLVAVYMGQVLEGLAYLHGQGVIHRDVKGANILITKEGLVKLADFGVATKLSDAELKEQSVVGTPYWMAPEVIEMAGVSAASDIWSVGCTAIELLTCSPPYYDLQPMTALFRIVRDDTIPLPEGISASLKDFLLLCFRKDPKLRPSAKELLSHPWLLSSRQKLSSRTMPDGIGQQTPNSVTQVVERLLEEENEELMASSAGPGEKIDDVLLAEGVVEVHVNGIAEKHAWKSQGTVAMVSQGVAAEPRKPGDSHVLHDVGTGPVQRMVDSMVHAPTFSLESWLQNMDSEKDSEICRLDSRFYAVSLTGHEEELSNLSSPMGHPSFDKESPVSVDIANNISHLKPDKQDGVLISCCQMLVQLFETKPDSKFLPVVNHIVVPIVELLEHSNHHVIVSVLKLANVASADNFKLRKKLCMCGILPRLLQFASSDLHEPLRIEVARFCQSMCSPSSGVEIFLAGNGAPILVELLKTNQETCCLQAADLALKTTKNVFQTHTALSILELCHLFSNLSLLNRLFESLGFLVLKWRELEGFAEDTRLSVLVQQSFKGQIAIASSNASDVTKVKSRKYSSYHNAKRSLSSIFSRKSKSASRSTVQHLETEVAPVSEVEDTLDDSQIVSEDCLQMIKGIAQLLLVFSHCDANVKIKYCEQENLHTLFAVIMCLPKDISCILVRSLKHLTLEASVLDQIQEVGAIPLLVSLLLIEENDWNLKKEALAALYNLCKVSKARQEEAAMAGAIPFLQTVVNTDGHMKQLAVPLLCGMVHASKATRAKLSALNILELYLRLLSDEQWNIAALEAVASWMAVDPSAVLHHLLKEKNVEKIVSTLEASSESGSGPFLHTLELLLRMLARSSRFNAALAISGLPAFIVSKLGYEDAIIKLQLLRLLRLVYQHHPEPKSLIYECGLEEKLQALVGEAGQDEPILVKQMAQTILDSLTINTVF